MHEGEHGEQGFGAATQASEWDRRYSEGDGVMWSGRPNGRLVVEVADLTPGRALDVGCGVYHDLDDEHRDHMKSEGFDPADYVGADDLGRLFGDNFTVELHVVEPRIDPPPDTPHIADVVLRARRR